VRQLVLNRRSLESTADLTTKQEENEIVRLPSNRFQVCLRCGRCCCCRCRCFLHISGTVEATIDNRPSVCSSTFDVPHHPLLLSPSALHNRLHNRLHNICYHCRHCCCSFVRSPSQPITTTTATTTTTSSAVCRVSLLTCPSSFVRPLSLLFTPDYDSIIVLALSSSSTLFLFLSLSLSRSFSLYDSCDVVVYACSGSCAFNRCSQASLLLTLTLPGTDSIPSAPSLKSNSDPTRSRLTLL
jgi:hypothetical protein